MVNVIFEETPLSKHRACTYVWFCMNVWHMLDLALHHNEFSDAKIIPKNFSPKNKVFWVFPKPYIYLTKVGYFFQGKFFFRQIRINYQNFGSFSVNLAKKHFDLDISLDNG